MYARLSERRPVCRVQRRSRQLSDCRPSRRPSAKRSKRSSKPSKRSKRPKRPKRSSPPLRPTKVFADKHYRSSLVNYPPEVVGKILREIASDDDIQAICRTSKEFANMCREDWFWHTLLATKQWSIYWPLSSHNGQALKPGGMEPKDFFLMMRRMAPKYRENVLKLKINTVSIDRSMFSECEELQLNMLPPQLKKIEEYGFKECSKLALTELPTTLEEIGPRSFLNCKSLVMSSLPASITSIGVAAFRGCDFCLTVLPPDVRIIQAFAFADCKNLAMIQLRENLGKIETCAFLNCTRLKLESFTFKEPPSIDDYAFCGCSTLMATDIREAIEEINSKAFHCPHWLQD